MKAVWLKEFGRARGAGRGDAPDPVAGPGQALIEVAFANITFVETQVPASGFGPFKTELPMIPGNGVGGVVTSVGAEADAPARQAGGREHRRFGRLCRARRGGCRRALRGPDGLALDSAVALLADGRTATMLVRAAGLRDGERVLVEAAAGGVGTLLVQLARAAGARVVAAAGGASQGRAGARPRRRRGGRLPGAGLAGAGARGHWRGGCRLRRGRRRLGRSAFELLDRAGGWSASGWRAASGQGSPDEAAAGRGVDADRSARPTPEETRASHQERWPRRRPAGCAR